MYVIELSGISFSYNGVPVFNGLNFKVKAGDKIGIMGPNGAGKTTLLQTIVGLVKPSRGVVKIFGEERRKEKDFFEVRKRIGYVFQDPEDQLFCPSVEEDLAFGPLNLGWSRDIIELKIKEILKHLNLKGFEKRVTYKLSGGEKRLVALGTVLIMEPEVLLLDEPTGDLDAKNVEIVKDIIKNFKGTCLVVSHDIKFLKDTVNNIIWFEKGIWSTIWTSYS